MTGSRSNLYWRPPSSRGSNRWSSTEHVIARVARAPSLRRSDAPLTIAELEAGLQILDRMDNDTAEFWKDNELAFQATVRLAIRETAEALLLQRMPQALRDELESQLAWLSSLLISKENRH